MKLRSQMVVFAAYVAVIVSGLAWFALAGLGRL